ncbi:hypothetical protein HCG46_26225 [Labrenzia sp. PO1]|nr:hypothetical protein [Labrenzia sp. PO1]NKI61799.1 hypothetical protein [Labrenzia sp. PO1]
MKRLPLPPKHRGVSHSVERVLFTAMGRAGLAAMILLALTIGSHFRHM